MDGTLIYIIIYTNIAVNISNNKMLYRFLVTCGHLSSLSEAGSAMLFFADI
jgi:hypothetical protein